MLLKKNVSLKMMLSNYSLAKKLVAVDIDDKTRFATISLQRPPVNSLNLELLTELSLSLKKLEEEDIPGIILRSASDGVFTAGIDIHEIFKPKEERFKLYWTTLQDVWIKLYGHRAPIVACINGHALAGGCMLALSCDYRVMVENKTIGLNETQLGLVAPTWSIAIVKNVLGHRKSEIALHNGKIYTTEEALHIGLIDEVAENSEDCVSKSKAFLELFKNIPYIPRSMTKRIIRADTLKILTENQEEDLNSIWEQVMNEKTQHDIEIYLKFLRKKDIF